jgi:glycosyltransferase involved in cell wall biosynthesis
MIDMPKVGVVVIGRNEGQRLELCLESILRTQVPCVYVDSQSTDDSVAEAKKRAVTAVVLDDSSPINASRARNTGFEVLVEKYPDLDYVHFIDADCELDFAWLPKAIAVLDKMPSIAIICGRLHEKYRNKSIYMRLCDMDWYVPAGSIARCGGIFTVRKGVFSELGGFDTTLIAGADPEFCLRLTAKGGEILALNADMGTHDSAMYHFSQWWHRCTKVGFGYANGAKWGSWQKQARSSLVWGALLPVLILVCSFSISPFFLGLIVLYFIQIFRIYKSNIDIGTSDAYDKYLYAQFCVLAKFPEARGVIRYFVNSVKGKQQKIIEYKA